MLSHLNAESWVVAYSSVAWCSALTKTWECPLIKLDCRDTCYLWKAFLFISLWAVWLHKTVHKNSGRFFPSSPWAVWLHSTVHKTYEHEPVTQSLHLKVVNNISILSVTSCWHLWNAPILSKVTFATVDLSLWSCSGYAHIFL